MNLNNHISLFLRKVIPEINIFLNAGFLRKKGESARRAISPAAETQ